MPSWYGSPAVWHIRSLTTNGTPWNGPGGRLGRARRLEQRVDHRVQLAVERLDALDRALHELLRRHLPRADQLGLGGGVQVGIHEAGSVTGRPARVYLRKPDRLLVLSPDGTSLHRAPQGPQGLARKPRGLENVPGAHHPDPRARVRRLRQRGGEVPRRRAARGPVHRLPPEAGRLRPAPGRRPDDPGEAPLRRHHAGADGGLRRRGGEVRAPQQGPHHHPPEHPAPPHPAARRRGGDPRAVATPACPAREGCGNTVRNVTGDPWAGRLRGRAVRPHALRGRLRALLRAPPHDPADAAQGQDGLHRDRRGPRDHRHPRRGLHPAHPRRRARASRCASAAAPRSCRASPPPSASSSRADDGEYLKLAEAVLRIFDRQEWLRANRARARIKVFVDKFGIEELRARSRRSSRATGSPSATSTRSRCSSSTTRRPARRRCPEHVREPQRRRQRVRALRAPRTCSPQRQAGLLDRPDQGDPRRPDARAVPRARRDHARLLGRLLPHHRAPEPRAALGARREPSTTSGARSASWVSATPAPTRSTTWSAAPAPTRASSASPARWGSTTPCASASRRWGSTDPLTRRVHIKMSGCPNGCSQHHIANIGFYGASIKVGEHTIPAYVAHIGGNYEGGEVLYGTRLKVRLAAKRVPDAVERWLRMYEGEREDGEAFNAYAERVGTTRFEDEARDLALPIEFILENMKPLHRLAAQGALPGDPGGGRMRGLIEDATRGGGAGRRGRAPSPQPRPGLLLPEGGVGADRHADAHRAGRARVHDRHRRALPRDLRDLAQDRGPLRPARGGHGRHPAERHSVERGELLRAAQGGRARPGARRRRTPGSRGSAASSRTRAPRPRRSNSSPRGGCGSSIRSPTGARPRSGATCTSTTFLTIRSTTRGTLPSAAPPAPCLETAVKGVGPARRKRSADCTYERARQPA